MRLIIILCSIIAGLSIGFLITKTSSPNSNLSELKNKKVYFKYLTAPEKEFDLTDEYKQINLPHHWPKKTNNNFFAAYQIEFNMASLDYNLYSIYIPGYRHNMEIYINELFIGSTGVFSPRVTRNWRTPFLLSFNRTLLKSGKNKITIISGTTFSNSGYLSDIYINKSDLLSPHYQKQYLWSVIAVRIESAILFFSCLIGFLLFVSRQNKLYQLYAITAFCWALYCALMLVTYNPNSSPSLIGVLMQLCIVWFAYFFLRIINILSYKKNSTLNHFILINCSIISLLTLIKILFSINTDLIMNYLSSISAVLAFLYTLYVFFKISRNFSALQLILLTTNLSTWLLLMSYDLSKILNIMHSHTFYVHHSVFIYLVSFLVLIIEYDLKEKTTDVKREEQLLLHKEKETIRQNIHDGVASKLVSMVSSIKKTKKINRLDLEQNLHIALSDLRDVFTDNSKMTITLIDFFKKTKHEIGETFSLCEIKSNWTFQTNNPNTSIEDSLVKVPQKIVYAVTFNLEKIFCELAANIIKHSEANLVDVDFSLGTDVLVITVCDNGIGIPKDKLKAAFDKTLKKGTGLISIRNRVEHISGKLITTASKSGTKAQIYIPIEILYVNDGVV